VQISLESKALAWALLISLLSLSSVRLAAISIRAMPDSSTALTSSTKASFDVATTPELVAQGKVFYGQSCSHCHGDDATGDEGPNLHNLSISNTRIAATIKKGIKGKMPTFAKKYDDHQIAALVSYLRTLR